MQQKIGRSTVLGLRLAAALAATACGQLVTGEAWPPVSVAVSVGRRVIAVGDSTEVAVIVWRYGTPTTAGGYQLTSADTTIGVIAGRWLHGRRPGVAVVRAQANGAGDSAEVEVR